MKIIFVRHGKDDDRYRGGWSSHDLIPEGIAQAKLLAEHIKERKDSYRITQLLSSDLPRTMTTAGYLSEVLGLPIRQENALRETNNGVLAGMLNTEALERYPGLFFNSLRMNERYPDGESPEEFYSRIKTWFFDFCSNSKTVDSNVLVVSHSGVINIIYHLANGIPWNNKTRIYKIDHCSIHILDTETMKFEVQNQTDFLQKDT